ncbi:TPA: site-specific DNA-methyltransferase [bacterium]|nr:site-specific DNA-methyltransferase [bacterium]
MLLHGDCLFELKKIDDKSVDLVYLDPPFYTQKRQSLKTRDNTVEYSFDDTWDNIDSYKTYIQERLLECRRVLKDSGSIFLHCDRSASHYLRIALDEVFDSKNFQSEIIWIYRRWSNAKKGLLNSHQVIKKLLIRACQKNGFNTKVLVKTNNKVEFNLFGTEAKDLEDDLLILDATKGIDSNTKNNLYLLMQTKIPN